MLYSGFLNLKPCAAFLDCASISRLKNNALNKFELRCAFAYDSVDLFTSRSVLVMPIWYQLFRWLFILCSILRSPCCPEIWLKSIVTNCVQLLSPLAPCSVLCSFTSFSKRDLEINSSICQIIVLCLFMRNSFCSNELTL